MAESVNKIYRSGDVDVPALVDLDLTVGAGELVAVMGPSGSGKTTLLNCLSGLDDIDAGRVRVAGRDLFAMSDAERTEHRARSMGFVFQSFNLIPVFTAVENVELPLLLVGTPARQARAAAVDMLGQVGLAHRENHLPNQMSGGEQQRVTIARALVARPAIVWADEPTGNLDTAMAEQVMALLRQLNEDHGQTIVLVTHDPQIGAAAGRLVLMRDGRLHSDERRDRAPSRRQRPSRRTVPAPSGTEVSAMYPELTRPLLVLLGAALAVVAFLAIGRPVLRRLACRQVTRRPAEAVLVVLGSLLGTTLIVASLVVGDSLDRSVRQTAYDVLGPIDEVVRATDPDHGTRPSDRLQALRDDPTIDGLLTVRGDMAAASSGAGPARWQHRAPWCGRSTSRAADSAAGPVRSRRPRPGARPGCHQQQPRRRARLGSARR